MVNNTFYSRNTFDWNIMPKLCDFKYVCEYQIIYKSNKMLKYVGMPPLLQPNFHLFLIL